MLEFGHKSLNKQYIKSTDTNMRKNLHGLARCSYAIVAAVFLALAGLLPILTQTAGASGSGGLLEPRSITMSDATPGATTVTYQLKFTPATTEATGAIIVDFCSDTPIIGATCAYSNATVPVDTSATASVGALTTSGYHGHTMEVTGLSLTSGTPFTETFSSMINPTQSCASTVCTFYARILTYSSTANANGYTPASSSGGTTTTGTYVDWGGDALSTVQTISVTATVMEQLTFCDSGSSITTCSTTSTPSVTLGHGGPPAVLTASAVDTGNVYTQTSTNALSGVSVAMKATTSGTTCGGLSSNGGTSCGIPAVNTGSGAPSAVTITAGTAGIGMCVDPGSANTVASQPYNGTCTGSNTYGMNDSTNGGYTNLTSTYGSVVFTSTGPLTNENDTLTFGATASNVTPAGIYTANYTLVATGKF
jgi:hypothetical protein